MKEGWKYKKLGDIATFSRGLTYSGKDEVPFSNNVVLRSNNINLETNSLNFDELKYISDSFSIPNDKKLKEKTIFMCMSNGSKQHLGKVAYIDKDYPYAFGGFMGLILPYERIIYPKYLYFYFCSSQFKQIIFTLGNGANINNIKFVDLAKNNIPLPPLPVQQSIVAELDKTNELIRLKKEQLKDLDALAQSIFYDMFGDPVENEKGWEVKKLGEVGRVVTGNTPPRNNDSYYNNSYIEWIKTDNILDNRINPSKAAEYLSEKGSKVGRTIESNSLLVACIAGSLSSIGKCCITNKKVAFNQQINGIMPHRDKVNVIFLYSMITVSKKYIQEFASNGMKHILSKSNFEQIPFILPPLPLQQSFAKRIESIEKQKEQVTKAIKDLETLLASRMQYWFDLKD